jgi:putative DNA primase/helicase
VDGVPAAGVRGPSDPRSLHGWRAANAVGNLVRSDRRIHVQQGELDAHRWLIACPGGYIDENNTVHEPDPGLLFTRRMGVRPEFSSKCPVFDARLLLMCNGDKDKAEALLRAAGYSLSGTGQEQKYFFLHGSAGGEGKTTLLELFAMVAGGYGTALDHKVFMRGTNEQRFGTSTLAGAWFVYTSEIPEGEEWDEATLKTATGSGMMPIEQKRRDPRQVPVRWGLWFQGNFMPRFRKIDYALVRRQVVFNFDCPLPEPEQRKDMARQMFLAEGPAIAAQILRARQRYSREGLLITPEMQRDSERYFADFDYPGTFLRDEFEVAPGHAVPVKAVHGHWLQWRQQQQMQDRYAGNVMSFGRELRRHKLWREWCLSEGRIDLPQEGRRNQQRSIIGLRDRSGPTAKASAMEF